MVIIFLQLLAKVVDTKNKIKSSSRAIFLMAKCTQLKILEIINFSLWFAFTNIN